MISLRRTATALTVALTLSILMSSCIGKFALFNKLRAWNETVGNKWANELVFVAFWIIPVYEFAGLADITVVNSIEFWSGTNPIACGTRIIDGVDGRYRVTTDPEGYTIVSLNDGSKARLDFNADDKSWSLSVNDMPSMPLLTFIDETHVDIITPDGSMRSIELSQQGVMAYEQLCQATSLTACLR